MTTMLICHLHNLVQSNKEKQSDQAFPVVSPHHQESIKNCVHVKVFAIPVICLELLVIM